MVGKPGAQPRVSARITLEEHHGHFALGQSVQAVADQRRARPLALSRGLHGDGTEYLHVDEPSGSIEHAPGEQHVPDDLTGILGDETEPVDGMRPVRTEPDSPCPVCEHRLTAAVDQPTPVTESRQASASRTLPACTFVLSSLSSTLP